MNLIDMNLIFIINIHNYILTIIQIKFITITKSITTINWLHKIKYTHNTVYQPVSYTHLDVYKRQTFNTSLKVILDYFDD